MKPSRGRQHKKYFEKSDTDVDTKPKEPKEKKDKKQKKEKKNKAVDTEGPKPKKQKK